VPQSASVVHVPASPVPELLPDAEDPEPPPDPELPLEPPDPELPLEPEPPFDPDPPLDPEPPPELPWEAASPELNEVMLPEQATARTADHAATRRTSARAWIDFMKLLVYEA